MEHPALRTVALPVLLPAHRRASAGRRDRARSAERARIGCHRDRRAALVAGQEHSESRAGNLRLLVREYVEHYNQLLQRAPPPARSPTHVRRRTTHVGGDRLDPSRLCLRPSPGTPDASRSRQVGQSGRSPHHDPASGGLPVRRRGGAAAPAQNAVPSCASTPVVGVPRRGSSSRSTATSTRSGSRACVSGLHVVPTRSARPWPASCSRL